MASRRLGPDRAGYSTPNLKVFDLVPPQSPGELLYPASHDSSFVDFNPSAGGADGQHQEPDGKRRGKSAPRAVRAKSDVRYSDHNEERTDAGADPVGRSPIDPVALEVHD